MNKILTNFLILLSFLSILLFSSVEPVHAKNDQNMDDIITGNLICLYPVRNTGNVRPAMSPAPCDKEPDHTHFFLDTGRGVEKLYAVEGSEETINRLKKTSKRKNIQLKGKISGNQRAWIITVE